MSKPRILVAAWLPDGVFERLATRRPEFEWIDAREPAALDKALHTANVAYGLPPLSRLSEATDLRWIQLISAGVPHELCPVAKRGRSSSPTSPVCTAIPSPSTPSP